MIRRYSMSDQMDEWFDTQGFYRKHTPKDGSCLFRAVSEQVFNTQALHLTVRKACVDYMTRNREKFEEFIDGPFDDYLSNLSNPKGWAGQVEMTSMSLLFDRDFLVFQEIGTPPLTVTDNNCKDKVMLYFSHGNHYDNVYPKGFIIKAAFCQSMVYGLLYKEVFRMGDEVDLAVEKMLHDKAYAKLRKDSATSVDSTCAFADFVLDPPESSNDWDEKDLGSEIRRALAQGFPPFPYKVAKALDPDIYRNVAFDVWNEAQKDEVTFEPGVECVVRLDKDKPDSYNAHIQEVSANNGPVTVYIVELGKMQTVPYESLEPLPYKRWQKQSRSYKSMSASSYYPKTHMNGTNSIEMADKYKGRKKFYKKGKFKDVALFPIRDSRNNQSLLPMPLLHVQSHQSQFDSSFLPLGRGGRGPPPIPPPFNGIVPRNPAPHIKWISPSPQNQRFNNRNNNTNNNGGGGGVRQYFATNGYGHQQQNGVQNFASSGLAQTSVTWANTVAENTSNNQQNYNGPAASNNRDNEALSSSQNIVLANAPSTPPISDGQPVATVSSSSSSTSQGSSYANPPPALPPQKQQQQQQPLTIYPCPYFATGLCVPYEAPLQPIDYAVPRSQDPGGNDLPFQDLPTLRFFFNLGCDYFRLTSGGPPIAPQHIVWNYGAGGPPLGYPTGSQTPTAVNGYPTPASSSERQPEDSSTVASISNNNTAFASPCLSDVETAQPVPAPVEEQLYETAYIYSPSPSISFVPGLWTHPIDYGLPPATIGIGGDYKSGLILNEQGVLSLSPCPPQFAHSQIRPRSDSGSSCRSQRGNGDWNNVGYSNATTRPKQIGCGNNESSGSYNNGIQQQQQQQQHHHHHHCQFSPMDIASQQHRSSLQQQQQSPSYPFVGQPVLAYGMSGHHQPAQSSSTSATFNFGNSMMSASPTSLGINYSTGSPVGPLFTTGGTATAATYYSPPHPSATATLVYSPPNHPIPYFSPSAH